MKFKIKEAFFLGVYLMLWPLYASAVTNNASPDSIKSSVDTLAFNRGKLQRISQLLHPGWDVSPAKITTGRAFSKSWFNADGFPGYPLWLNYDALNQFDAMHLIADLSLMPSDNHKFHESGGSLDVLQDTISYSQPYTNLHYQIGSYQYKNLFVRHRQVLGRWELDLHGQNVSGDDGHPLNNGNQANIFAGISYRDSRQTYYRFTYDAWRILYRYNPWYADSSIVRQARDNTQQDTWTLKRVWQRNEFESTESGIRIFNREGNWTPAQIDEQGLNYQNYSAFMKLRRVVWGNLLSLEGRAGFYTGKTRRGELDGIRGEFLVNGNYQFGKPGHLIGKLSMFSGFLPGLSFGKGMLSLKISDFLDFNGGIGLLPEYDQFGMHTKSNFTTFWGNIKYRVLKIGDLNVFAAARSRYFDGIRNSLAGLNFNSQVVNALKIDLEYRKSNFLLAARAGQKLSGFSATPEQSFTLQSQYKFRLISRLFIKSKVDFNYAHNYSPYLFDMNHYLLKNYLSPLEHSFQLDIKISAMVRNFEIYYQGIHLDAFMVDGYDFIPVLGFAHDLPRYRFGVRWILFN